MTTDEALLRGAQFTRDHLGVIAVAYGERVAIAYAASMACGTRNYVAEKQGAQSAFDLMSGLADDVLTSCLTKG